MSSKIAFIFPGQGSQAVGMGREWAEAFPEARHAFEEADDALGFHLTRLAWEGPEEELQLTTHTQPAILACSIAVERVAAEAGLTPRTLAGHSLGEYSALVAASALDFGAALNLVRSRGAFMQDAVPVGQGAMAAILGLEVDAVDQLVVDAAADDGAAGQGVCVVANYNSPLQTVISGDMAPVERAAGLAGERGAKRAKLLPVSAPFHSPLMRPARERLAPLLADATFHDPAVPVVTNIDAVPSGSGAAARDALERQVDGPVRWVETIRWMIEDGAEIFVEVGPGTVLTGLGRRIDRDVQWFALPKPAALDKLL